MYCIIPATEMLLLKSEATQLLANNSSSRQRLAVLDDDSAEEEATCFAECTQASVEDERVQLAQGHKLNAAATYHGRVIPDVVEGETGELTAPTERHGNTTE